MDNPGTRTPDVDGDRGVDNSGISRQLDGDKADNSSTCTPSISRPLDGDGEVKDLGISAQDTDKIDDHNTCISDGDGDRRTDNSSTGR